MKLGDGSVRIEPLTARHDRNAFQCGNQVLDRYIREHANQDIRRGMARVFVAVLLDRPEDIAGFFTLSAASIVAAELPPALAKRLPRYPVPAALIGRLAVSLGCARRGLGGILLADAVKKAVAASETVAMTVIVVDPIDDAARTFYSAFGFTGLHGTQRRMFLALPSGGAVT